MRECEAQDRKLATRNQKSYKAKRLVSIIRRRFAIVFCELKTRMVEIRTKTKDNEGYNLSGFPFIFCRASKPRSFICKIF